MTDVLSYNILDGGVGRETEIISTIKSSNPDIVLLQEVFDEEALSRFSKSLDMDYKFIIGNSKRNLGLMSKIPIAFCQTHHPFPPIRRAFVEARFEYEPGKYFHFFGVHLQALHGVVFEAWRLWEITIILRTIKCKISKKEPCLIAGDFNAIAPRDRVIKAAMPLYIKLILFLQGWHIFKFALKSILDNGFSDCYRFINKKEDGFTLPTNNPNARLDYFFANKEMIANLKECLVANQCEKSRKASDHYPILTRFDFSFDDFLD